MDFKQNLPLHTILRHIHRGPSPSTSTQSTQSSQQENVKRVTFAEGTNNESSRSGKVDSKSPTVHERLAAQASGNSPSGSATASGNTVSASPPELTDVGSPPDLTGTKKNKKVKAPSKHTRCIPDKRALTREILVNDDWSHETHNADSSNSSEEQPARRSGARALVHEIPRSGGIEPEILIEKKHAIRPGLTIGFAENITALEVDAILNSASKTLHAGSAAGRAINDAGGHEFIRNLDATRQACGGKVKTGAAVITDGGAALKARFVIDAVGPYLSPLRVHGVTSREKKQLQSAYQNAYRLAAQYKVNSMAIVPLGAEGNLHSKQIAVRIMVEEALAAMRNSPQLSIRIVTEDETVRVGMVSMIREMIANITTNPIDEENVRHVLES
ncbi:MAG: O-acetyl-ADP-ribose deacetylase [Herminiimonas sp.]|nr:O-acetyl-ADP-ribose deacetylase [Herminiimonas sp.]